MPSATTIPGRKSDYSIDHRNGLCEKCRIPFVEYESEYVDTAGNKLKKRKCPTCGGEVGMLIYRESSVMFPELPPMPPEPSCYTVECINAYKKEFDRWSDKCKKLADYYRLIHEYHQARCGYCQRHRNDFIEDYYRTGELVPDTVEELKREIKYLKRR